MQWIFYFLYWSFKVFSTVFFNIPIKWNARYFIILLLCLFLNYIFYLTIAGVRDCWFLLMILYFLTLLYSPILKHSLSVFNIPVFSSLMIISSVNNNFISSQPILIPAISFSLVLELTITSKTMLNHIGTLLLFLTQRGVCVLLSH